MQLPPVPALGVAALVAATVAAAPIPAPVVVQGPLDLPPRLEIAPAVTAVDVPPEGELVTHRIDHGLEQRVTLDLRARSVRRGADGAPVLGDPVDTLRLPAGEVTLDPGERATVRSVVTARAPDVVALEAVPRGDAPASLVAYVLVAPDGTAPVQALATTAGLEDQRLTVTLLNRSQRHATTDVRVRFGPVLGPTVVDETLRDVLVWPDASRPLVWELELGPWPGPYRVEVAAAGRDEDPIRTSELVWPGRRGWLPAVALVLVLVTAVAWWLVRRHRVEASAR